MVAAILLFAATPLRGQDTFRPEPPDEVGTAQLVWTTMIAIDHANRTGNYSVLRDLAAPSFREANDPARLAAIFAKVRETNLPLGRTVTATPVYTEQPAVQENGLLRVKGSFPLRPYPILFDMLFQQLNEEWRLFGVSVVRGTPTPVPRPAAGQAGG